eukprot:scaffold40561_cov72-Phaeocystis_antarctica.AAC.2
MRRNMHLRVERRIIGDFGRASRPHRSLPPSPEADQRLVSRLARAPKQAPEARAGLTTCAPRQLRTACDWPELRHGADRGRTVCNLVVA